MRADVGAPAAHAERAEEHHAADQRAGESVHATFRFGPARLTTSCVAARSPIAAKTAVDAPMERCWAPSITW